MYIASIWEFPQVLILTLSVTLLTGFFAGSYPAFYVSAFKAVQVFKSRLTKGKKGNRLRKILVVTQFAFSIILILMTVITMQQNNHNRNVDLGFDRTGIITARMSKEASETLDVLKKELLKQQQKLAEESAKEEEPAPPPLQEPTSKPKRGLFSIKKKQGTRELGRRPSG